MLNTVIILNLKAAPNVPPHCRHDRGITLRPVVLCLSISEASSEFHGVRALRGLYKRGVGKAAKKRVEEFSSHDEKLVISGKVLRPSQQGDLDRFCGIYSLVNAIVYLNGHRVLRNRLRHALITEYSSEWDVAELMDEGMDDYQLDHLIQYVLKSEFYQKKYPVDIHKPFARTKKLRIGAAINRMQQFLSNETPSQRRVVLIGTQLHWTLIYHIDDKYLYWFDSSFRRKSFRRSFSFRSGKVAHVLRRKAIYFMVSVDREGL